MTFWIHFGIHVTEASLAWLIPLATALQWGDLPYGVTRSQMLQGATHLLREFSWVLVRGKKHVLSFSHEKAYLYYRSRTRTDRIRA